MLQLNTVMLYHDQDYDHTDGAPATAAAAAHVDPHPPAPQLSKQSEQPPQPSPQASSQANSAAPAVVPPQQPAPAAPVNAGVTAPLSVPGRAVVATPAVAHNEPVLVGKVVSAESSAACSSAAASAARSAAKTNAQDEAHDEDARFDTSSSCSVATSDSVVGDVDKTELLFDFGRYVGQVDPLTGLRDGQGCLHYKSGNVYTGSWRNGAADGFGEKRYKNGDIYRGHWVQGKRSGRGAYLFAQGHFYDGMYANDQPEGYGIYTTLQGDRYAGSWKAGHKSGKGRETLVNGQVFVGNWRNGKKQGRGKLYLPGAENYIYGIWNNDKFFRELTGHEMGVDGKEDVVDEFGLPRDASAPPITPPWMKPAPLGAAVTDRVLMGVTALEDRMESLGKALERVMGGSNTEGVAPSFGGAAAGGANASDGRSSTALPHLRYASADRGTADGVLASDFDREDEEDPAEGVELRRLARATDMTPPASVLSTAVGDGAESTQAVSQSSTAAQPSAAADPAARENAA